MLIINAASQIYLDELRDDYDREEDEIEDEIFLQSPTKIGLCSENEPALLA